MRSVQKASSHFEYPGNRLRNLDIIWQSERTLLHMHKQSEQSTVNRHAHD